MRAKFFPTVNPELAEALKPHTNTQPDDSQMRRWLRWTPNQLKAAVIFSPSGDIIGWSCVHSTKSIGCFIDEKYRKQGLGTKALNMLLKQDLDNKVIRYDAYYEGQLLCNAIERAGYIPKK